MKCQNCNQIIARKSKFCPNCGEEVKFRSSVKNAKQGSGIPMVYGFGLLGLGILLGFALFKFSLQSGDTAAPTVSSFGSPAAIQSPAVLDIAKDFICPCGTCNDPLDVCTCDNPNGAVEVKSFIAQKLREGHKKPHIVEMLTKEYPGLKSKPGASL
ncbi:MAG: hypothetical protein ACE5HO_10400 [bacterium]